MAANKTTLLHDGEWLRKHYVAMGMSMRQIAKLTGTSRTIVSRWLRNHGIKSRPGNAPYPITKDELFDLYVNKQMSIRDIARHGGWDQSVISRKITKWGIPARTVCEWHRADTLYGTLGTNLYGPGFTANLKRIVKERDHYRCRFCDNKNMKRLLHVHHMDQNKDNNHLDNLITLCDACHAHHHGVIAFENFGEKENSHLL